MTPKRLTTLSKEEFQEFLSSVDVVLSDCDGVLWRETEVIPGSPEAVNKLKELGKRFYYITNNNTKTRSEFVDKCKGLNYTATEDEIVCTSFLAAVYLKGQLFNKKVYIVGNTGIAKELEAQGIQHCGIAPDVLNGSDLDMIMSFKPDPEVGAVIVGFDKDFSFPKLVKAATYLSDPNVYFIGTNCDTERPSPNSNRFPGTGCLIKAVEAATGRTATLLGKPDQFLSEYVIKKYSLNPQRTLMIGDSLKTDMLLGKRCGFKTLLVLSGTTTMADLENLNDVVDPKYSAIPDYYVEQLSDILQMCTKL